MKQPPIYTVTAYSRNLTNGESFEELVWSGLDKAEAEAKFWEIEDIGTYGVDPRAKELFKHYAPRADAQEVYLYVFGDEEYKIVKWERICRK